MSPPTYTVVLREERFTLSDSQIRFDSPNSFTGHFLGGTKGGHTSVLYTDRRSRCFPLIQEWLSGYDDFFDKPLEGLNLKQTLQALLAEAFDCRTLTADGLPTTSVLFIEPDDHFLASGWISGNKESTPIPVDFWDSTAQQACVSINNKLLSLGALMRYFVTPSAAALKTPSIQAVHDLLRPDLTPIEHRIVTIRARSAVGYWAHKHLRFSHIDVFTADFSAAPAPAGHGDFDNLDYAKARYPDTLFVDSIEPW